MKKFIYFIVCCFLSAGLQAQVLWTENFDNYPQGDLGFINMIVIPPPPRVMAQGDWILFSNVHTSTTADQYDVTIEAEPGKGNILKIQDIPIKNIPLSNHNTVLRARKTVVNMDANWNNRAPGNDILKIEGEFYVALEQGLPNAPVFEIMLHRFEEHEILSKVEESVVSGFAYTGDTSEVKPISSVYSPATVPTWTWIEFAFYIDYTTGYVYFEIPSTNFVYRRQNPLQGQDLVLVNTVHIAFISDVASNNGDRFPNFVKLDNFKMSAVDAVPLSLNKLAADTFSIFPNPVTDELTITNSQSIGIEQLEMFDSSGKSIKSLKFDNETTVQLNISDFASGIYYLQIKTKEGIAVEKVVKK